MTRHIHPTILTYLYFLAKAWSLYLDECRPDSLHVGEPVVEGDPARPDGVFELVGVEPRVDHAAEQVVEDDGEGLGGHHAVQRAHEHSLLRVQPRRLAADVVGVREDPWDNLNFLQKHEPMSEIYL